MVNNYHIKTHLFCDFKLTVKRSHFNFFFSGGGLKMFDCSAILQPSQHAQGNRFVLPAHLYNSISYLYKKVSFNVDNY